MTRAAPLVSIVTPAYNQGRYLASTIESVLAQDYGNVEYIVLDDGSSDETPAVLARYEGRIRFERHENIGQARTLNKGWAMARGDIVGYLSSDDLLAPEAVSAAVDLLVRRRDAVACYPDFALIDASGRFIREVKTEEFDLRRLEECLVCQPGPGAFFRKTLLAAAGGWNPSLRQVPDFEFWLRASRHGAFVRIPRRLASFRIHEGSASFRSMSRERANELVDVMAAHWGTSNSRAARRSRSRAFVLAARHHSQSGRFADAIAAMASAFRQDPANAVSPLAWYHLMSGTLRRSYYQLSRRAKTS